MFPVKIQREDVWAITPQLVLDKVAGLTKFSEETLVIAAGNRPEDAGTLVRMIHNPLLKGCTNNPAIGLKSYGLNLPAWMNGRIG
jgi:hypothetical protein